MSSCNILHDQIFAYGQTGSGKTFTIQGVEGDSKEGAGRLRGILPRVLEYLFAQINDIEQVCGVVAALPVCKDVKMARAGRRQGEVSCEVFAA